MARWWIRFGNDSVTGHVLVQGDWHDAMPVIEKQFPGAVIEQVAQVSPYWQPSGEFAGLEPLVL